MRWDELNRRQLGELLPEAVVVVPTGATEQHGPHLPVGTDTFVVEHVAREAAAAVADRVPLVVAPTLPYGSSHHHLPFGGTMSLTTETYFAVMRDLVASLIESGFRRVVIVNGHGGNHELMQLVVRDLALKHPADLAALSYWLPAAADLAALRDDAPSRLPGHAGAFETSLIMALRPDLVRHPLPHRDSAQIAALTAQPPGWRLERHGAWQAMDGFSDSPNLGAAERGRAYLDAVVRALAQAIRDFHAATLRPMRETIAATEKASASAGA